MGIKASGKYFVGDGKTDIEAGKKIGMKTILVLSGKSNLNGVKSWNVKPDFIFKDLFEAVNCIINNGAI